MSRGNSYYGFDPKCFVGLSYAPNEPAPEVSVFRRKSSSSSDSSGSETSTQGNGPFEIADLWERVHIKGPFPPNMVRAGVDCDGEAIYVGRAFHEGDMLPAKVIPTRNKAYVCHGGVEVSKKELEVLRYGAFVWESAADGQVPEYAVKIGQTGQGEPLYMGRAMYSGTQTPGKVHPSHGCCYLPFDGEEVSVTEYEVLCVR